MWTPGAPPVQGCIFCVRRLGCSQAPRLINYNREKDANWALPCIQSDLQRRLGLAHQCVSVSRRQISTIPCDEDGWVKIDDTLAMEILWTHESRRIDNPLDHHDRQRRTRQLKPCTTTVRSPKAIISIPFLGHQDYGPTEW